MTTASMSTQGELGILTPPSWRLMMSHPAHQLSFGFGSGLIRPAPGTWGTLRGWETSAGLS
jgi:phosphatidylglycerophosphatase A